MVSSQKIYKYLFFCIFFSVLSAKGLLTKGKNGTNNCFVTIALGKEKYQTSIKDKAVQNVDWREECELYVNFIFNHLFFFEFEFGANNLPFAIIILDRYRSVVTVLS